MSAGDATRFRGWAPTGAGPWARRAPALLLACAALLLAAQAVAVALARADLFRPNLVAMLASGLPYALAAWLVMAGHARVPLRLIVLVALACRLPLLPFDPDHSTDIYRYVWEGRIQAAGFSPYLHVPGDPDLAALRDAAIWPRINRADYAPTIYPPVAQAFFLLVTRVSETILAMKLALVACEGVAVWAMVRLLDREGLPRDGVLLYAWCPLTAWEIAGSGHVDALMIACALLALLASRLGRAGLAGAALGAAFLVKFFPLVLAPALWRRWDLRLPAALIGVVVVGYLVYGWGAGARVIGFAPTYASEEGIRDGTGFWLMRPARLLLGIELPSAVYLALAASALLAVGAVAALRVGTGVRRPLPGYALALATLATFLVSPQYPWYFLWCLALVPLAPASPFAWPVIWLAVSGPLLYWDYIRAAFWIGDVVYGGAGLLFLAAVARRNLPARAAHLVRRIEQ